MNKNITKYLKDVLNSSCYPVINFKDNDYIYYSYEEFLKDEYEVDITSPICTLLTPNEIKKMFDEETKDSENKKTIVIECVTAYKTLKTSFHVQTQMKKFISELTGIYYIPFDVKFTKQDNKVYVTHCYNKNKNPWYPICFLLSNLSNVFPKVTEKNLVDNYLKDTTYIRNKIDNWEQYIEYCDKFFQSTGNLNLEYENKCFIFRYDMNRDGIIKNIDELYDNILESNTTHELYNNIINMDDQGTEPLISDDFTESLSHAGQMNKEFPLAKSQRQAVNHMHKIHNGEVLAVSGPPGTGKTTLLQSVVADMVVNYALNEQDPPVIVATSANNQAVTNIIDSFTNVSKSKVLNLDERWVYGVDSFAVYMPSDFKIEEAKKNNYQYSTKRNHEFLSKVENSIDESKKKLKECASIYFNSKFTTIEHVKNHILSELKEVESLKRKLLSINLEIENIVSNQDLLKYIEEKVAMLVTKIKQKEKYRARLQEWGNIYKKINIFKRLLSFLIPSVKKQVSKMLFSQCELYERSLFKEELSYNYIENCYTNQIFELSKEIEDLNICINNAKKLKEQVCDILEKLVQHNCDLKLLKDDALEKYVPSEINELTDTAIRYIEFWLAIHINECRFILNEYALTDKQYGTTFKNVLEKFYRRMALLSPCFVMTCYKMPYNFACLGDEYLYDYIDLLIFDEAGQCAPEIAIANFSLAKKAIVVGDEYQIPPVYNVDELMDISLAKENGIIADISDMDKLIESGISCSQGSVMRMAKTSCKFQFNDKIRGLFLQEHRRCYDDIISYCNELIYNGLLIPMRNNDEKKSNKCRILDYDKYPVMGLYSIESECSIQQNTSRINKNESRQIAQWIKRNYKEIFSLYLETNPETILSIITPFSAQANVIRNDLKKELGNDAKCISVGTVHTFQGAERKIIIFSTVYGEKDSGKFIENNKNLLNVAVSRAKDAFWIFGDENFLKNKSSNSALGKLYTKVSECHIKN